MYLVHMASWGSQLGAAVVGGAFCFAAVGKAIEPAEVIASLAYLAGMMMPPPPSPCQSTWRIGGLGGRL